MLDFTYNTFFTIVTFALAAVADFKYGQRKLVPPLVCVLLLTCYFDSLHAPYYTQWVFFPAIAVWKRSYEIITVSGGDHDFIVWETGLLTDEAIGRLHVIYRAARFLAMITISKLGIILALVDYIRYMHYDTY